jgi:hypothetical protein
MTLTDDMTKAEMLKAAEALVEAHPELAELNDKMTKAEIAAAVDAAVGEGEADRAELFARLLKEMPDAVLVPRTDALLRLANPSAPSMTFEIRAVEGELGMRLRTLEEVTRRWRTPEDNLEASHREPVRTTPITDVPTWAREQVLELVEAGTLRLFATAEEASAEENTAATHGRGLLDSNVGKLDMKVVYAKNTGMAQPPVLVEPTGEFTAAEQEAAWNVINGVVEGEYPLPDMPDAISEDPADITKEEYLHVKERIERCLQHPEPFTERSTSRDVFDERTFFNQLLQIEYGGFTPTRHGNAKQGGVRAKIVRLIRQMAKERGFEVMGDYVVTRQERGEVKVNMPTVPFTANRAPQLPFNAHIGSRAESF